MFLAYPQMLYHPDGRKKVVRDEQHHAEMAREGFCAIDDAGKLIPVEDKRPVAEIDETGNPLAVAPSPDVDPPEREVLISEAVRDMAEAFGIDWRTVEGTGKDGRVLKSDIQKLIHDNDHQNG